MRKKERKKKFKSLTLDILDVEKIIIIIRKL